MIHGKELLCCLDQTTIHKHTYLHKHIFNFSLSISVCFSLASPFTFDQPIKRKIKVFYSSCLCFSLLTEGFSYRFIFYRNSTIGHYLFNHSTWNRGEVGGGKKLDCFFWVCHNHSFVSGANLEIVNKKANTKGLCFLCLYAGKRNGPLERRTLFNLAKYRCKHKKVAIKVREKRRKENKNTL